MLENSLFNINQIFLKKFTFQKCKYFNNPRGVVSFKSRVVTLFQVMATSVPIIYFESN